jgi:hypothetical protein
MTILLPPGWDVLVHRPRTPPPLRDGDLAAALESPEGQPPLREIARGCHRPVVIVDDLTRPTPANLVLPHLIRQLEDAGIERRRITIVVGSGSHGPTPVKSAAKKIGDEIAAACRIIPHDHTANLTRVGRTSFGTPILTNDEIASSDLVLGIGGVYPQHSTGFGGGSKLVMGVLGQRSIVALHYRHRGMSGSYRIDNSFRRDLDEIAMKIGLRTAVSIHVDEGRRPVRVATGDHLRYYEDAARFSLERYSAPPPGDADVVIANAYPMDVSLTFARSKGIVPLLLGRSTSTKVLLAACPEGVGHHGVFPLVDRSRLHRPRALVRTARWRPGDVPRKVVRRAKATARSVRGRQGMRIGGPGARSLPTGARPIWVIGSSNVLPDGIPGFRTLPSWEEGVLQMMKEQREDERGGRPKQAVVYVCAPLQTVDIPEDVHVPGD